MAWYLGGKRVYVEEDTGWAVQRRTNEIHILDSTKTIIHDAGRPSYQRTIQFVVFSGYHENIAPLAGGTSVELVSDQGSEGNVYIKNLEPTRIQDISRSTVVTRVKAELIKDDS